MSSAVPAGIDVKVSVAMITYNQEAYVELAIQSALMQEVDFPVEIVIGDDCSTDGTRRIVESYAARYPERIRPLLHPRNLGHYGKYNLNKVLQACRGQYVALLEGDDYWTDPFKLQKQVTFLDKQPECAICFHDALMLFEDGSRPQELLHPMQHKQFYTLGDLLQANFLATLTVMFRNGLIAEFPDWYYEVLMSDWPLHILNAQHGSIGYINECMAVYRVHDAGAFSGISQMRRWEAVMKVYEHVGITVGPDYASDIQSGLAATHLHQAYFWLEAGDRAMARDHFRQSLSVAPRAYRWRWFTLNLRLLRRLAYHRLKPSSAPTGAAKASITAPPRP